MTATITIYNNRLGFTTLAAAKELSPAARAALQTRLRIPPGGSVTLPREVWQLMARRPGNWALVKNGEISTRLEDTARRKPPTSLEKIDRTRLGAPKGPGDFVHGLKVDPVLLRDIEQAQARTPGAASRKLVAQAALASTQPGDYAGLLAALAAEGVSLEALREHLDHSPGAVKPSVTSAPKPERASAPSSPLVLGTSDEKTQSKPEGEQAAAGERSGSRSGGKKS